MAKSDCVPLLQWFNRESSVGKGKSSVINPHSAWHRKVGPILNIDFRCLMALGQADLRQKLEVAHISPCGKGGKKMKPIHCKTCLGRCFGFEKPCNEFSFRDEREFISEGDLIEYVLK